MIRLPLFIFKLEQKGWFKALGLHHASVTLAAIIIGHLINPILGIAMALFLPGMYFGREYKEFETRHDNGFEIMDFVSPLIVGLIYVGIHANLTPYIKNSIILYNQISI